MLPLAPAPTMAFGRACASAPRAAGKPLAEASSTLANRACLNRGADGEADCAHRSAASRDRDAQRGGAERRGGAAAATASARGRKEEEVVQRRDVAKAAEATRTEVRAVAAARATGTDLGAREATDTEAADPTRERRGGVDVEEGEQRGRCAGNRARPAMLSWHDGSCEAPVSKRRRQEGSVRTTRCRKGVAGLRDQGRSPGIRLSSDRRTAVIRALPVPIRPSRWQRPGKMTLYLPPR